MHQSIAPASPVGRHSPPPPAAVGNSSEDKGFRETLRKVEPERPDPARQRAEPSGEAERPQPADAARPATAATPDGERPAPAAAADESAPPTAATAGTAVTGEPAAPDRPGTAPLALLLANPQADPPPVAADRLADATMAPRDLPALQQILAGAGFGEPGEAGRDPRQPAGRPSPPGLLQLLKATTSPTAAGVHGTATGAASLAATAVATDLAGTGPEQPAATPPRAAELAVPQAAVPPAAAPAPAVATGLPPALDPGNPLAGQGTVQTAGGIGETNGAHGSSGTAQTPARAAAPVATPSLQIAVHIAKAAQEGLHRLSVRLDPPELGRVDVRLEVGFDGRVTAVVAADRQETLDMLQRDARDLARMLKEAGLQADSGSLSFTLRQDGGHAAADEGADGGAASAGAAHKAPDEDTAAAASPPAIGALRALDINV